MCRKGEVAEEGGGTAEHPKSYSCLKLRGSTSLEEKPLCKGRGER